MLSESLSQVYHSEDDDEIAGLIGSSGADIVFGSLLEQVFAKWLDALLIECAKPTSRVGLTTEVGGFRGSRALFYAIVGVADGSETQR